MTSRRRMPNQLWAVGLAIILTSLLFVSQSASAQSPTISISNLILSCSNATVTYEVSNAPETMPYVYGRVDGPSGQIGVGPGDGGTGNHSLSMDFDPPQPENTTVTVTIELYNEGVLLASAARTENCSGGGNPPTGDGWPGDNRLNPDRAEYYTIYCTNDQINVWAGAPEAEQRASIPLTAVVNLDGCTSVDGVQVCRSDDTITISGGNGYTAPATGQKSFSFNECVARNGGLPDTPAPAQTSPEEDLINQVAAGCFKIVSPYGVLMCIQMVTGIDPSNVLGMCYPAPFMVIGGPLLVQRRRRRRIK